MATAKQRQRVTGKQGEGGGGDKNLRLLDKTNALVVELESDYNTTALWDHGHRRSREMISLQSRCMTAANVCCAIHTDTAENLATRLEQTADEVHANFILQGRCRHRALEFLQSHTVDEISRLSKYPSSLQRKILLHLITVYIAKGKMDDPGAVAIGMKFLRCMSGAHVPQLGLSLLGGEEYETMQRASVASLIDKLISSCTVQTYQEVWPSLTTDHVDAIGISTNVNIFLGKGLVNGWCDQACLDLSLAVAFYMANDRGVSPSVIRRVAKSAAAKRCSSLCGCGHSAAGLPPQLTLTSAATVGRFLTLRQTIRIPK